jgi:hypothetical protein
MGDAYSTLPRARGSLSDPGAYSGVGGERHAKAAPLRREVCTAAAAASTEQWLFARLWESGVIVRLRASTKEPGEITGYSVGLAHRQSLISVSWARQVLMTNR